MPGEEVKYKYAAQKDEKQDEKGNVKLVLLATDQRGDVSRTVRCP